VPLVVGARRHSAAVEVRKNCGKPPYWHCGAAAFLGRLVLVMRLAVPAIFSAALLVCGCSSSSSSSASPCEQCKPTRITCLTISGEGADYDRVSYDAEKCTYQGTGVTPHTVDVACDPDASYPQACFY
jgi:hypothetical protein